MQRHGAGSHPNSEAMKTIRTIGLLALVLLSTVPGSSSATQAEKPPAPTAQPQKAKPPAGSQEQEQAIELSSRLVNVFFNVTDQRSAYLTDLRKEEIQVLEDKKPQEIFTFSRQTDLPLTISVLIDVSGSEQFVLPLLKSAASQFFRSFVRPDKDVVSVAEFRDETVLLQDFTATTDRLERALERVRYTPPTSRDSSSRFGGTSLYDAIYVTCEESLARQAGRRTIILLTDGDDTTSTYKIHDAIDRALRTDVTIYAVGIGDRIFRGVDEGTLKRLAGETGGRGYFPRKEGDLMKAFKEIENELRTQYYLAYYPSNSALDGSYRSIQILVPGREKLRITHRRGYYAPGAKK